MHIVHSSLERDERYTRAFVRFLFASIGRLMLYYHLVNI